VSVVDVMMVYYLRKYMDFKVPFDNLNNITRLLEHIKDAYNIGYESMDKKELQLNEQILKFSSS
jgi:hypothetical protein